MPSPLKRSDLLADRSLTGRAFCSAYGALIEGWLIDLFEESVAADNVALVALGGQGRGELCPQSDLDLLLLIGPSVDASDLAEQLWYPIWDAGLKLGHSVRTVRDTLALASDDLETATSLLTTRHLAGNSRLSADLAERAKVGWRRKGKKWLEVLARSVENRHEKFGEIAFDLEPDLKEGRGGLRDVHALAWAMAAGADLDERMLADLAVHHDELLTVRVELHRASAKPGDLLLLQEQDLVAGYLDLPDPDSLMVKVATAGRAIAWASDESWLDIKLRLNGTFFSRNRRERDLGGGLLLRDARVSLEDERSSVTDPAMVLRVACAAAREGTRISRETLDRLAEAPTLAEPWPDAERAAFIELLMSGRPAISVIEALDQRGIWTKLLPEWKQTQSLPQRNPYHRYTVDRHLLEAVAEASMLAHRTPRPDLLVMGALLHDIGKGHPGDHSEVGEQLARQVAERLGFSEEDVSTITALVRHHLLLLDIATRRDLDDPATIEFVARTVQTSERLAILRSLSEADSIATGTTAWGPWKSQLLEQLTTKVGHLLSGARVDDIVGSGFPSVEQRALLDDRRMRVIAAEERITIACPDRVGVVYRVAGALALHSLDITEATINSESGMVVDEFRVRAPASGVIAWERVTADVVLALEGKLAIQARLQERVRSERRRHRAGLRQLPSSVQFDNDASGDATVIEVGGPDSTGLLFRLTRALADLDLDVKTAKIHTIGVDVVDTFYVVGRSGRKILDPDHQAEIRRALLFALEAG